MHGFEGDINMRKRERERERLNLVTESGRRKLFSIVIHILEREKLGRCCVCQNFFTILGPEIQDS